MSNWHRLMPDPIYESARRQGAGRFWALWFAIRIGWLERRTRKGRRRAGQTARQTAHKTPETEA